MDLDLYFNRIGFIGRAAADRETLFGIHRAHALSVPFENLDIQLGAPVSRDPDAIFDKIVRRWRGGWCYEQNGLLARALEEIGFRVRRLAAGVGRAEAGDGRIGNHLALLVDLSGDTYLADVGFGDGPVEPVLLRDGSFNVGPLPCRLESIGGGWRRFSSGEGESSSYDFHEGIRDEALLDAQHAFLCADPRSPFVQNAVAQIWLEDAHLSTRGRRLTRRDADGKSVRIVGSAQEFVSTLKSEFGLDLPDAARLWNAILSRDAEVFGEET